MDTHKIQELINNGENSGAEFKRDDTRPEQLANCFCAPPITGDPRLNPMLKPTPQPI